MAKLSAFRSVLLFRLSHRGPYSVFWQTMATIAGMTVLSRRAQFLHVGRRGKRRSGRLLRLLYAPNESEGVRFGFVISKKVGNAVVRNRLRRRLRAILHDHGQLLQQNTDHVFICFASAGQAPYGALSQEVQWLVTPQNQTP